MLLQVSTGLGGVSIKLRSSLVRLRIQSLIYLSPKTISLSHTCFHKRNGVSFARTGSESLDTLVPKSTPRNSMTTANRQSNEADQKSKEFEQPTTPAILQRMAVTLHCLFKICDLTSESDVSRLSV